MGINIIVKIDEESGGGGSTDVASKIKTGTSTVVQDVAKQVVFSAAFSSALYNVEPQSLNGSSAFDFTITDQLATGFKITCSESGTLLWKASLKTE